MTTPRMTKHVFTSIHSSQPMVKRGRRRLHRLRSRSAIRARWGRMCLGVTNIMMRQMGDYGATQALRLDELPVIKSFFRDDPAKSTQFTEDFYRIMTQANQVYSTIRSYRKEGRQDDANELLKENGKELSQRKALTATQKQVRGLNQAIEMVMRDRILTAGEKRDRIDKLMARRNAIVQQTVERVNPYFN